MVGAVAFLKHVKWFLGCEISGRQKARMDLSIGNHQLDWKMWTWKEGPKTCGVFLPTILHLYPQEKDVWRNLDNINIGILFPSIYFVSVYHFMNAIINMLFFLPQSLTSYFSYFLEDFFLTFHSILDLTFQRREKIFHNAQILATEDLWSHLC